MLQLFSQCRIWVHLIRIRSSVHSTHQDRKTKAIAEVLAMMRAGRNSPKSKTGLDLRPGPAAPPHALTPAAGSFSVQGGRNYPHRAKFATVENWRKQTMRNNMILTASERATFLGFARMLNEGQEQELFPLTRAWLAKSRQYRTGTRARRLMSAQGRERTLLRHYRICPCQKDCAVQGHDGLSGTG